MSANSIEWHRACLKNTVSGIFNENLVVERRTMELVGINRRSAWYQYQYDKAVSEGKRSFDESKYLASKKDEWLRDWDKKHGPKCPWVRETDLDGDPIEHTGCGNELVFIDGTPSDNDYKFCPYCGRKILIVEPTPEPDSEQ